MVELTNDNNAKTTPPRDITINLAASQGIRQEYDFLAVKHNAEIRSQFLNGKPSLSQVLLAV